MYILKGSKYTIKKEIAILKILKEKEKLGKPDIETIYKEHHHQTFDKIFEQLVGEKLIEFANDYECRLTEDGRGVLNTYKKFHRPAYEKL